MYEQDNEQANWEFLSSRSCNLHPAHWGEKKLTKDHRPFSNQRGHNCAPSTRQTLKIDTFLQEFLTRPLTWPGVNNGNYSARHPLLTLRRVCLSCDIILIPEKCFDQQWLFLTPLRLGERLVVAIFSFVRLSLEAGSVDMCTCVH